MALLCVTSPHFLNAVSLCEVRKVGAAPAISASAGSVLLEPTRSIVSLCYSASLLLLVRDVEIEPTLCRLRGRLTFDSWFWLAVAGGILVPGWLLLAVRYQ